MEDVWGRFLGLPHGTTPAAVTTNKNIVIKKSKTRVWKFTCTRQSNQWKVHEKTASSNSRMFLIRTFLILADNDYMQESLDEFEIWQDSTMDYGVSCLRGYEKNSNRLIIGKTMSSHFIQYFSSPEPKAHMWAYSIPLVRRPLSSSVHRPLSTCWNIFFSKSAWPIKAKFYVEPP